MVLRLDKLASRLGRRNVRPLVLIGFLTAALAAALGWYGFTSRQIIIDDALREMQNDASMLADQEDELLQAIDGIQRGLIAHFVESGIDSPEKFEKLAVTRAVYQDLRDRVGGFSPTAALLLCDRYGRPLNFSRDWPPPPVNDTDQGFFHDLITSGVPEPIISAPFLSKATGEWDIFLSRRFEAPDGRLIGFVLSPIQIDHFQKSYAQLPLTGGASFALFRRDGTLSTRYPPAFDEVEKKLAVIPDWSRVLDSLDHDVVRMNSYFDGKDRLIVAHSIKHFPLIVAVGDTTDSILHGWKEEMRILVSAALSLEVLIGGMVIMARRSQRSREGEQAAEIAREKAEAHLALAEERERAERTLHIEKQRFDMAVQNMVQGLLIADRDGNVLAVNNRFCELWGLPPDIVKPGMSRAELQSIVASQGNIRPADADEIRRLREEAASSNSPMSFILNWSMVALSE